MSKFLDGVALLDERCGNFKDNLISLATVAINEYEKPVPYTRDVDAFYEDGCFYIMTLNVSVK